MTKQEYMSQLSIALKEVEEELAKEIMEDYEEHFQVGLGKGKSENQICMELGNIEDFIRELKQLDMNKKLSINNESFEQMRERNGICEGDGKIDKEVNEIDKEEEKTNKEDNKTFIEDNETFKEDNETFKQNNEPYREVQTCEQKVLQNGKQQELDGMSQPIIRNDYIGAQEAGSGEVQKSVSATKIMIKALFADVSIQRSPDNEIKINCYSEANRKQKMVYHFQTWQKEDTIYAEVIRSNSNVGFFQWLSTPYMRIDVTVPEHFPILEINSASGNTEIRDIRVEQLNINSASGDISLENSYADRYQLETKSGDFNLRKSHGNTMVFENASGDITIEDFQSGNANISSHSGDMNISHMRTEVFTGTNKSGDIAIRFSSIRMLRANSISGEVSIDNAETAETVLRTTSGDVRANQMRAEKAELSTVSGDVECNHFEGNRLKLSSKSGDISTDVKTSECNTETISGNIQINSIGNAKLDCRSTSGDIDIRLKNNGSGYEANVQTTSGNRRLLFGGNETECMKNGSYCYGNSGSKINTVTISGDIQIRD